MIFKDRKEAGQILAQNLEHFRDTDSVVLAVPRGGVPVGFEIAKELRLPLEIILSKKIGHPSEPEFAIGAVTLNSIVIDPAYSMFEHYIEDEIIKIRRNLEQKKTSLDSHFSERMIFNKTVILTDDGIATGRTILATIEALRKMLVAKIVVAIPVSSTHALKELALVADEVVCPFPETHFIGVGQFYLDFTQVDDSEVKELLEKSRMLENKNSDKNSW